MDVSSYPGFKPYQCNCPCFCPYCSHHPCPCPEPDTVMQTANKLKCMSCKQSQSLLMVELPHFAPPHHALFHTSMLSPELCPSQNLALLLFPATFSSPMIGTHPMVPPSLPELLPLSANVPSTLKLQHSIPDIHAPLLSSCTPSFYLNPTEVSCSASNHVHQSMLHA